MEIIYWTKCEIINWFYKWFKWKAIWFNNNEIILKTKIWFLKTLNIICKVEDLKIIK